MRNAPEVAQDAFVEFMERGVFAGMRVPTWAAPDRRELGRNKHRWWKKTWSPGSVSLDGTVETAEGEVPMQNRRQYRRARVQAVKTEFVNISRRMHELPRKFREYCAAKR